MQNISRLSIVFLVSAFILSSCNKESDKPLSFQIEKVDSVNIDFIGKMVFHDYDAKKKKYLLNSESPSVALIEVDENGQITYQFDLEDNGRNPIPGIASAGYVDDALYLDSYMFTFYKQKNSAEFVLDKLIPYEHTTLYMPVKLPVVKKTNEAVFYIKPLKESFREDQTTFYDRLYDQPLLEKHDLSTGKTHSYLKLPEESVFKSGLNHGIYVPTIKNVGNDWLLATWIDDKLFLYKEDGDSITFAKSIDLQIDGFVSFEGAALENGRQFYESNRDIVHGNVNGIFDLSDYIVVTYQKGMRSEDVLNYRAQYPGEVSDFEIQKQNRHYAAILDKSYNVLASNVQLPYGISFPIAVNEKDEILVKKNEEHFDQEEDVVTIYKLKITQE